MAGERCTKLNEDEAELLKPSSSPPPPARPPPPPSSTAPPSLFLNPPPQELSVPRPVRLEIEAPATANYGADAASKETRPPVGSINRCSTCRKRVGLAGFRCRCGELFCGRHRYSDTHDCSFDYKAAGREEITKNNPLVRAAKILKI